MSNYLWSSNIQRVGTLEKSRALRFCSSRKNLFLNALGLERLSAGCRAEYGEGLKVLDVGCGPGTLVRRLAEWLGRNTLVYGIDRDTAFIEYARQEASRCGISNAGFIEGDALDLPFADNMFDACTSFTVIEHLPNMKFIEEQQRVCKPGGCVSVMSVRTEASIRGAEGWPPQTEREKELWAKVEEACKVADKKGGIAAHGAKPVDIIRLFEELGFGDIKVSFIPVYECIDDGNTGFDEKMKIIDARRQVCLDAVELAANQFPGLLPHCDRVELDTLVNRRFDERTEAMMEGRRIWDFSLCSIMAVRGIIGKGDNNE